MGADIHSYAEVLVTLRDGSKRWEAVGPVFPYPYHRPQEVTTIVYLEGEDAEDWIWNEPLTIHPYLNRNYDVFAILADVRNGRGFAGCDTGDGFIPIDGPRGLPRDVSSYVRHQSESWGVDGHSHTWFTLAELKAYDWSQTTTQRGYVTVEEYRHFKEHGRPESWCGDVGGRSVEKVDNAAMDLILADTPRPAVKPGPWPRSDLDVKVDYYTQVAWQESYREAASDFLEVLPRLEALLGKEGVEDVRFVCWFDN